MSTTQFRSQSEQSLSSKVITTVAAQKNADPTKLEPPLYEVIDPDALDSLFAPNRSGKLRPDGEIRFTYSGCEIQVTANGDVRAIPVDK